MTFDASSGPAQGVGRPPSARRRSELWVPAALLLFALVLSAPTQAAEERRLGERPLSLGSWGADVFQLQQELRRAGYEVLSTGTFGRQTHSAVLSIQVAHGIEPDGVVGPNTLAALRSEHQTTTYTVRPGDSLWAIAQQFDTTVADLMRTNALASSTLNVGDELQVPMSRTYTVRSGDTLGSIAARFGTDVESLAAANGIEPPYTIRVGQQLRLVASTP